MLTGTAAVWVAGMISIRNDAWPILAVELGWLAWLAAEPFMRRLRLSHRSAPSPPTDRTPERVIVSSG